jgi:hypothetical protein
LRNPLLTAERKAKLTSTFNAIILEHAPQRHSSEVALVTVGMFRVQPNHFTRRGGLGFANRRLGLRITF